MLHDIAHAMPHPDLDFKLNVDLHLDLKLEIEINLDFRLS